MRLTRSAPARWLAYRFGRAPADSQLTESERDALKRHAAGKSSLVEIGVMHGVSTALLRSVMASDGTVYGIDPHRRGRLGVSFERLTAKRQVNRVSRGRVVLIRKLSFDAAVGWKRPIDFLFVDGDHSWAGIERDWNDWSGHVVEGGLIALHDSRSVPDRADLDSVRFTQEVVRLDPRFEVVDAVHSLTVLRRRAENGSG